MATSEPNLASLPPAPRRVRLRGGIKAHASLWFVRFFILPHTVIGVALLGQALLLIAFAFFNRQVTGTAVNRQIEQHKETVYAVRYQYVDNGHTYLESTSVDKDFYNSLSTGPESITGPESRFARQPISVRHLDIGPIHHADLAEKNVWSQALLFTGVAAFWNGILSVFLYGLWIAPLRQRLLLRYGAATKGRVTGKGTNAKSHRRQINYHFEDPATLKWVSGTSECQEHEAWREAQIGDELIVVYSTKKPHRSVAPAFCLYTVPEGSPIQFETLVESVESPGGQ